MQRGTKSKGWCFPKNTPPPFQVDKGELKKRLTPVQYLVTQEKSTERPFSGEYLKLKDNGSYACLVCGEELFSSETKYDSGCGWPAFYDITDSKKVNLKPDLSHVGGNLLLLALKPDLVRTEVTCFNCGAHLGHLFDDGPKPTGKRYCINSAALKFKEGGKDDDDHKRKIEAAEMPSDLNRNQSEPATGLRKELSTSCCLQQNNKTQTRDEAKPQTNQSNLMGNCDQMSCGQRVDDVSAAFAKCAVNQATVARPSSAATEPKPSLTREDFVSMPSLIDKPSLAPSSLKVASKYLPPRTPRGGMDGLISRLKFAIKSPVDPTETHL